MSNEIYLIAALVIGLVAILAFWLNQKISQISEKSKPAEELLEVIRVLQDGSKEDRKVLLDSLQKNTQLVFLESLKKKSMICHLFYELHLADCQKQLKMSRSIFVICLATRRERF